MSDVGTNTLLMGGSGAGKTYSLRTLISSGIQVRAVFLEPRWGSVRDLSCSDGFHIHYVNPTLQSWEALRTKAENLTRLPWDAAVKWTDPKKSSYDGYLRILHALHNFTCRNCGEEFGDATTWGPDVCLWFDGLAGLNQAALQMVVGGAVTRSQPQWGAAQEAEIQLIRQAIYGTPCHFVLISHVEKLLDEINGNLSIMPNALGKALGPEIPKDFDDVVMAARLGDKFKWTTAAAGVDLKATYLPLSDNLPPSFAPLIEKWKREGGSGNL